MTDTNSPAAPAPFSATLISSAEVCRRCDFSRSTLYFKLRTDPDFPKPIPFPGRRRMSWFAAEVEGWIGAQIKRGVALRAAKAEGSAR